MPDSSLSGLGKLAFLAVLAGTSFCLWQLSAAVERKTSSAHRVYRRRLIKRPWVDEDAGFRKLEKNLSKHVVKLTENRRFFAHVDFPAGKELLASVWDVTTDNRNATTTKGNTTSKAFRGKGNTTSKAFRGRGNTTSKVFRGKGNTTSKVFLGKRNTTSKVFLGKRNTTSKVFLGKRNTTSKVFLGKRNTTSKVFLGKRNTTSKVFPRAVSTSTKVPGTRLSAVQKRLSRRRRHDAVDDMEEAEVEEVMKRKERIPDETKKTRKRHMTKRLRKADGQNRAPLGSNSGLERYFMKEKTNNFFENFVETAPPTDGDDDDDDIESVYIREPNAGKQQNFMRRPSGILTDVTHIEKVEPYFEEEDIEAALERRAVPLSDYAEPGVDGSLTLGKLASVLNSNETINKLQLFSDNPSISVPWEEPEIMSNCWLHKMLAGRYAFSPSCKEDGNYFNKQCHLERCWCVENDGRTRDRKFLTRFSYKKFGQILYCTPPIHQMSPNNLPKTPQSQKEAMIENQNTNSSTPSSQAANVKPIIPSPQAQNQTGNAKPSIPSAQSSTTKP